MFGERKTEYSAKQKKEIPVWQTPKYEQSKKTALEIIAGYDDIGEGDFWILMNETKNGKMAYTGLIISHNACLKLNDHLPPSKKFKPEAMTLDKDGYGGSLVYTYCDAEQGLYEVGEVSKENCKNAYPYAMALKRCFDRVILKATKLAYNGVYSDSEADEFKDPIKEPEPVKEPEPMELPKEDDAESPLSESQIAKLRDMVEKAGVPYLYARDLVGAKLIPTKLQANRIATNLDRIAEKYRSEKS